MRRCRTSCSNRFPSSTTSSSFKHSMRYWLRTRIRNIGNCRRWSFYQKNRQRLSLWTKRDQFLFYPVLAKSTNDVSLSISFNGWKTMLFFHRNNRIFVNNTQPQRDSCSFFSTSAPVFCTDCFSRYPCGFHQGVRSTLAWRFTLQTAPNELSTRTSDLHYRIPEEPKVLRRNEPSHLGHFRHWKRCSSRILPWTDPIPSLSLWNGATNSFSHLFSSIRE